MGHIHNKMCFGLKLLHTQNQYKPSTLSFKFCHNKNIGLGKKNQNTKKLNQNRTKK